MELETNVDGASMHPIVPHPSPQETALKPYFQNDRCTIFNSDCFSVFSQLNGIDAIITDPPYSSGGQYRASRVQSTSSKYVQSGTLAYRPEFGNDHFDQRSWMMWTESWLRAAKAASKDEAILCSFIDWRQLPALTDAVQFAGWTWRGVAVWSKKYGRVMPSGFSSAAEYIVVGSNGAMPVNEEVYPPGVFECSSPSGNAKQHIAQKPEPVMKWVLSIVPKGTTVCDPFMGSGTTLRAAMDSGCKAIGIEVQERYCEMAAKRLSQGTPFDVASRQNDRHHRCRRKVKKRDD